MLGLSSLFNSECSEIASVSQEVSDTKEKSSIPMDNLKKSRCINRLLSVSKSFETRVNRRKRRRTIRVPDVRLNVNIVVLSCL